MSFLTLSVWFSDSFVPGGELTPKILITLMLMFFILLVFLMMKNIISPPVGMARGKILSSYYEEHRDNDGRYHRDYYANILFDNTNKIAAGIKLPVSDEPEKDEEIIILKLKNSNYSKFCTNCGMPKK